MLSHMFLGISAFICGGLFSGIRLQSMQTSCAAFSTTNVRRHQGLFVVFTTCSRQFCVLCALLCRMMLCFTALHKRRERLACATRKKTRDEIEALGVEEVFMVSHIICFDESDIAHSNQHQQLCGCLPLPLPWCLLPSSLSPVFGKARTVASIIVFQASWICVA